MVEGLDLLGQLEHSFDRKPVSIVEFAESPKFCTPGETPLWMSDGSFKSIEDIQIGDQVMGWGWPQGLDISDDALGRQNQKGKGWKKRTLATSQVVAVHEKLDQVFKITLESGRVIRCTNDHEWFTGNYQPKTGREIYRHPEVGMTVIRVIDPTPDLPDELRWDAAWLGGIFDGEGHIRPNGEISIAQCPVANPDIHARIGITLSKLGFEWTYRDNIFRLTGGRQAMIDFLNIVKPSKVHQNKGNNPLEGAARKVVKDRIVSIEPDGYETVYGLTTTTGNYVAWGYASKNCGKTLYPRQRLLLKIFFLEELTPEEDKILDYWIEGGADGEEIDISPNIRERMETLKEEGYKHFHEVILVGGRRCSKGFLTAISMAKLVYDLVQMQNPQDFYGIDKGKEIMFSVVAASEQQAKEMQYADFQSTVDNCNAVQRNLYKTQELEFSLMTEADIRKVASKTRRGRRVQRDESSIRGKAMAANARTIRGSATMGLVFDEFAFFLQGENDQSDEEIYKAAIPALAQFIRDGMIFCNSSPYSKVGKFYERYEQGMKAKGEEGYDPAVVALRFPSWALFEGWWEDPDYEGPKKCITASPDWDPDRKVLDEEGNETEEFFYTQDDRANIRMARAEEAKDPISYKVERRGFFAETIDAYLDPEKVDRMFLGRPVWDAKADPPLTYYPFDMNWTNATNRYQYAGHIDPSSTTAGFGFALAHTETLQVGDNIDTHVVFDVIQRWDPKEFPGGAIEWEPILEALLDYCWYFRPVSLTFDQHQNRWPMEWLQKQLRSRGIGDTRVFEKTADLQRNWNRAEVFRTALYHDRIHAPSQSFPDCKWGADELKYLQEIKTARVPRVEKQDVGPVQTKDVADCMMEVVEVLIGSEFDRSEGLMQPMSVGAPHGYRIGGYGTSENVPDELAAWYSRRHGEQGFGRHAKGGAGNNPARRPFGGRPVPRALPQRRLPGR